MRRSSVSFWPPPAARAVSPLPPGTVQRRRSTAASIEAAPLPDAPVFASVSEPRPARTLVIDGRRFDVAALIRAAVAAHAIRLNRDLEAVLASIEFTNFLSHCVLFTRAMIREQLVRTQERAARSWMDVPPAFLRQVNEIAKQDFFSTDGLTLAQVRHETDATLRQFSLSYCYLLLHNSRCAHAPARERHSFEAMYAIAIDTATSVLAAHSLDRVIDHELRRLFRSALFATDARPDVVDPVQAQFIAALAQRRGAAAAAAAPSACGSGAGASCPPGFAPLAALAGSLGALSPEPRAASAASRAASASRRSTGRTKEPRMGGIGQWGTAIGRAPPPLSPPPTLAASQRGVRPASGSVSASAPRLPAASRATSASTRPASSARSSRPGDAMQADAAPRPGSAAAAAAQARHKKISINAVRMLRSPLANETLPPVQRFLFVQSRPEAISSVVG